MSIQSHRDLVVYQRAMAASMQIFEMTKRFPREEIYALTSQSRRSSRGVVSNIVEAWRKRRYEGSFIAKLSDAETEAAETQLWIEYAVRCGYITRDQAAPLYQEYEAILRAIVGMIMHAPKWLIRPAKADTD